MNGEEAGKADNARMARADLVMAVFLIVLGVAIFYGAWTMPRLEIRRIHPLTVPGLVPGMLAVALTICGVILGVRATRTRAPGDWAEFAATLRGREAMRALVAAALGFGYALGLIGRMPFWAATGIFVFAFILIFEVWLAEPKRRLLASAPWALGLAVVASVAVTLVFERAFLVRLP
jgi:hypothetical protein